MEITFNDLRISEEKLKQVRKELYHSERPGFYVFKNFLSSQMVSHLIDFWTIEDLNKGKSHLTVTSFDKKEIFFPGCPNYFYPYAYNTGKAYYNFFWNHPADEASMTISFSICQLRNAVQSYNNYEDFFPFSGVSNSYRVVFSFNGKEIVPAHSDWLEPKEKFKPERLQATLILTKKGIDYSGKGMWVMGNDKKTKYVFDDNLQVDPGDLVLWRYNNQHGVNDVTTTKGQRGFIRMIFPPDFIYKQSAKKILEGVTRQDFVNELKRRIKKKFNILGK